MNRTRRTRGIPAQRALTNAVSAPEIVFSAADFNNSEDLYKHAKETIEAAPDHQELVYTHVPKGWARPVLDKLDDDQEWGLPYCRKNYNSVTDTIWIRIMPSELHNCHQAWIHVEMAYWVERGLLTRSESWDLYYFVGTTRVFDGGPYAESSKEPDIAVRANNQRLPTMVIESGWSESLDRLREEVKLWLISGNATVAIIICWRNVANTDQVEGEVELYTPDSNGHPVLRQTEAVFPEPPPQQARAQSIKLTRRLLFGSAVFPGRDPDDPFDLRLDELRRAADRALEFMELIPA